MFHFQEVDKGIAGAYSLLSAKPTRHTTIKEMNNTPNGFLSVDFITYLAGF